MTLLQLSQEYAYSAELLARRIAQLRQEEAAAEGEDERFTLHRRILDLQPMLQQCRHIQRLAAGYYDRSYYRDERYTV